MKTGSGTGRPALRAAMAALCAGLLLAAPALAQPAAVAGASAKPLRLIVPFPAGGAIDTLARSIAQQATGPLGQTVVIDNRPGAGGIIGMEACARATADGQTVCLATGEHMAFNPSLFPALPYDPVQSFAPVIRLVRIEGVIIAGAASRIDSMAKLIEMARERPGAINWASYGPASSPHLYMEWIARRAGVTITHVPYKGSAQTIPALLADEAQVSYVALGFVLPQLRTGRLRALATATPKRLAQIPDVPTLAELGLDPGFDNWAGLFVPAGTPRSAVDRLNVGFNRALADPGLAERVLAAQGYEPVGGSQEAFAGFVAGERAVAKRVVAETGISHPEAGSPGVR